MKLYWKFSGILVFENCNLSLKFDHFHGSLSKSFFFQALSAEPTGTAQETSSLPSKLKLFPKTDQEKKFIRAALSSNLFLKALSLRQLDLLADYMEQQYFSDNQSIITEGELGTHMYVLADGLLEVRKDKRILKVIKEGEVFGELAILYHCKSKARN